LLAAAIQLAGIIVARTLTTIKTTDAIATNTDTIVTIKTIGEQSFSLQREGLQEKVV
jgi:hypothetical protein